MNIIDERGTISLLAPAHGPKMLVAVAGLGMDSAIDMLQAAATMDEHWIHPLFLELGAFDEFNISTLQDDWRTVIESGDSSDHPAFRVIDPITRGRSLQPGILGLIVFNLKERRIIQVLNHAGLLEREGAGRYRKHGRPDHRHYRYSLPSDWRLVP